MSRVITGPGKTSEAVKLANDHDAYLAVRNRKHARNVYHSDDYPDPIYFPLTHGELAAGEFSLKFNRKVVIDDLNHYIMATTGAHLVGLTINDS